MPRKKPRDKDGLHERDKSPFWWASYPNGRGGSTRRSTGIRVDQDPAGHQARAIRAAWIAEDCHTPSEQETRTFDQLMLLALPARQARGCDPTRDKSAARALYSHFTGRKLADLTGADVRGYIATRQGAGLSPAAINKETGLMSAALNWARKELEWDVPNPFESRRLPEPPGRDRWLTREEAAALIEAAHRKASRAPWLADFIRLCLYTGLRPGEAFGLDWSRVDLSRRLIRFGASDQKSGKGGTVPMNEGARAALIGRARYRAEHCPSSQWVFCDRSGSRITSMKRSFNAAVEDAGLVDVHMHDLRRTFGSWLVQEGVGIERVSRLLRHSDVSVTARVYAHLRPQDLSDAAAVLDAVPMITLDYHTEVGSHVSGGHDRD